MILNYLPISACSGLLKFDMKLFVNIARLDIGQLFTQSVRWEHPCTLDISSLFTTWFVLVETCYMGMVYCNKIFVLLYDRDFRV